MLSTSILLLDDHALFCSGMAMILSAGLKDVVVNETTSLKQALEWEGLAPRLILLDVQLQGLSGLESIGLFKRKWPLAKIVMISALDAPDIVSTALARGAHDFISKTEKPERLLQRVGALLTGAIRSTPSVSASSERPTLTPRQSEVLDFLCQGMSNKSIGRQLALSEHTIRGHVQATLAALGVSSRSEAAFAARRLGLMR